MKKYSIIVLSFLLVCLINYCFIFVVAYINEPVHQEALPKGNINEVLLQKNDFVKYSDYKLLNWETTSQPDDLEPIFKILNGSNYVSVGHFEQVFVRLLQNRWNSYVFIWLNPDNYQKYEYDWLKQAEGSSERIEVVKVFGEYYIIGEYLLKDTVDSHNVLGVSAEIVYKAQSSEKISDIEKFKGSNPCFDSYSFYPIDLSPFVSTFFGKVLNIGFVLLETFIVYKIIKRFSKDKKHSK